MTFVLTLYLAGCFPKPTLAWYRVSTNEHLLGPFATAADCHHSGPGICVVK